MDLVVTEQLRESGGLGRKLIEGEEDVSLIKDTIENAEILGSANLVSSSARIVVPPMSYQQQTTSLPHTLPVPTDLFRSKVKRSQTIQPSVKEFLSRPFHEQKANRYLFSCADE